MYKLHHKENSVVAGINPESWKVYKKVVNFCTELIVGEYRGWDKKADAP